MGQPFFVPCSTVLLLGGSCGSCLTLRVDEDVTEEERDPPLWRCPLTQNNMTESRKQKGEGKGRHGGEKKCEYKEGWKVWRWEEGKTILKSSHLQSRVPFAGGIWRLHVIPFTQWTKCWQVLDIGWTCCNFTFLDVRRVSLNIRLQNKDMTTEAIGGTSTLETRQQQQQHFDQTSYSQSEAKWGLFGVHSEGLCCQ